MDIDMSVLRLMEREKDLPLDLLVEAIEEALITAYDKTDGAVAGAVDGTPRGPLNVLPSIQTVTVGTGVPPVRPGDPSVRALGARRDVVVRFADCDRRCGVPPPPEHASSSWTQLCHSATRYLTGVRA